MPFFDRKKYISNGSIDFTIQKTSVYVFKVNEYINEQQNSVKNLFLFNSFNPSVVFFYRCQTHYCK